MIVNPDNFVKPDEILFLTAVHGDEPIGVHVLQKLTQEFPKLNWITANEKALKLGIRFVDADLNRVAPGNTSSEKYEVRRAQAILQIANNYRCIVDIHSTVASTGVFTIVTNTTSQNISLAQSLPIDRIVVWKGDGKTGPLTQFVDCGVEIECGPRDNSVIEEQLETIVRDIALNDLDLAITGRQQTFQVSGSIARETYQQPLENFKQVNINGDVFYPLLVNQYPDILCYKMYEQT